MVTMNKQEKCDERAQIESESGDVQQKSIMPIAFSITNILSSSFGNAKTPTAPGCESGENAGTKRDRILLRLYDNNNADDDEDDETSPKPAKIPRRQQSDDEASNGMCISRYFVCVCEFAISRRMCAEDPHRLLLGYGFYVYVRDLLSTQS